VAGLSTELIGGFGNGYEPVRGTSSTATPPAAGATGNGGPARINNSLRYEAPAWYGLSASALQSAGEMAGSTEDARVRLGLSTRPEVFDVKAHGAVFVPDALRQRFASRLRRPGELQQQHPVGVSASGDSDITGFALGRHRSF
jgi:predicted porin